MERQLQLANFKQMQVSIREEATRWLGLLELGLLRDEAKPTESPRQGQIDNEVGPKGLGLKKQHQNVLKAKGKEITHQENCGSSVITYSRRTQPRQMIHTGVTTETLAETVEQGQKTPMTTLDLVLEPELTGTGSEMLGNNVVRLVKIMEKKMGLNLRVSMVSLGV
jgi:hypothetical protein